jgi:endonuclease YncB( thermonuclease family)
LRKYLGLMVLMVFLSVVSLGQAVQTTSNLLGPCWPLKVRDGDTVKVRLPDNAVMDVRYVGMAAPELEQESLLGLESQERNQELLTTGKVWLEVKSTAAGYLTDRNQRVLAHVFVEADNADLILVQEQLVTEGLGMLDLRQDFQPGGFGSRYADKLIAAQIDAAFAQRGIWSLWAFSKDKNLIIAAINFWSDEEAVYLINRGTEAIELADDWVLKDSHAMEHENSRNTLELKRYFGPSCSLPAGGIATIYTGSGIPKEESGIHTGCGTYWVELWWFGYNIWDQDKDSRFPFAADDAEYRHYTYLPLKYVEEEVN